MSLHVVYDSGLLRVSVQREGGSKTALSTEVICYLREAPSEIESKVRAGGYDLAWPAKHDTDYEVCFRTPRSALVWISVPLEAYTGGIGVNSRVSVSSFQDDLANYRQVLSEYLQLAERVPEVKWPTVDLSGFALNLRRLLEGL